MRQLLDWRQMNGLSQRKKERKKETRPPIMEEIVIS
jgi:hypothetical protein